MATRPVRTGFAARLALVGGSVLFTLLLLELGCRIARGPETLLDWKNIVLEARRGMAGQNLSHRFTYDPDLGYVQRAGFASDLIHYDGKGFRMMPPPPAGATEAPPIVATGDSFTQGDEVDDAHAWPAVLQELLAWRTVNAGVAAYGFDQTVLRTEQLARQLRPALMIVGFIADDLRRAEMKRTWGVEKPYFERLGNKLVLRNVPVPPSPRPEDTLSFWNWALGWSVAFDTFLTLKGWQYEWVTDHRRVLPPGEGAKVGCLLTERLAALGVPVLVVAQYDFYVWVDAEFGAEQHRLSQEVLRCANQAGLATVDTYAATENAVRERGRSAIYGSWHPNAAGYRLIAGQIAAEVRRRDMLKPR
jgi:lysophospholipase L1-like esterase